jgi:hypothetical protein
MFTPKYPEVMDLYGGTPGRFHLDGMRGTPKDEENHQIVDTFVDTGCHHVEANGEQTPSTPDPGRGPWIEYLVPVILIRYPVLVEMTLVVGRVHRNRVTIAAWDAARACACLAPSVGLSQPWRFILVDDPLRRAAVRRNFEICNTERCASWQRY